MLELSNLMRLPIAILIFLILVIVGYFAWEFSRDSQLTSRLETSKTKEKPLNKYTFDALSKTNFESSKIVLGDVVENNADFTSRIFFFEVGDLLPNSMDLGQVRRVSGLINIPEGEGSFPIIVMFRGYVDKEVYTTGAGTQRVGEVLASNGFITIAADFLGYGQSDGSSENEMEERFQTYTTAVTLLKSLGNLNGTFESEGVDAKADSNRVGIWGHSNGGQIAISVLEITEDEIPTVLWAPVSKPFPYSILFYTDEFDDRGKYLRRVIAQFEEDYDADDYSIEKFFKRINAPIQIHQGSADNSVPQKWSDEFVKQLEKLDKEVEYFIYPQADHNLLPSGWSQAVERNIEFYNVAFGRQIETF